MGEIVKRVSRKEFRLKRANFSANSSPFLFRFYFVPLVPSSSNLAGNSRARGTSTSVKRTVATNKQVSSVGRRIYWTNARVFFTLSHFSLPRLDSKETIVNTNPRDNIFNFLSH